MGTYIYALVIYPIEVFIETVFTISEKMIPSVGYAIVFVSLAVQLLALPLYRRADELQEEERNRQKSMRPVISHIRKTFHGDERIMMLTTYYRVEGYHSYYQIRALLPLLLQIPFFIAAYHFLSNCPALDGAAFYFLRDLSKPDAIIQVGGFTVNVMPIAMTVINIASGILYSKGLDFKDKLQLYVTAIVFLVLLYDSPSGLVFYWTLNNLFSLIKNVFLKYLHHPREIFCILSVVAALFYAVKCYKYDALATVNGRVIITVVILISMMPLAQLILDKRKKISIKENISQTEKHVFFVSTWIIAVTLGLLIPSITMATSPGEFVIRGYYVSPIVLIMYCFAVATGLSVLWGNIIYFFNSSVTQKRLGLSMLALSCCGIVDAIFFKQHLFHMSKQMQYRCNIEYSIREELINLFVAVCVVLLCYILYRNKKRAVLIFSCSILAVVTMISAFNIYKVQRGIDKTNHIKDDAYYLNSNAHITVDKNGKNVLIFMLDRSFGQYLPFIINEKPDLIDKYAGFTFYPNTISHGMQTLIGTPALFGGYEYTSYRIKDLEGDEYRAYINNALRLLPKVFSDAGYKCTVCDPPSYIDLEGGTLEDYYHSISPQIDAYYADGVMKTKEEAERDYDYFTYAAHKNYIRHSVFLFSPLILRNWLYDDGAYLMQERVDDRLEYAGHIEALEKLPEMTEITDSGKNTFTIIENDVTHSENVELQMPDYTLLENVDNSDLIDQWRDNLEGLPKDREINMYTDLQIQSYSVNMAALLCISRWLDFLRNNDIYDNTRIIIVGDHGFNFFAFDDMFFEKDGEMTDLEMMTPLLLVKDFGSNEFSISDEFMTNADVPSIATEGLILDPINPYTGNAISSYTKNERKQYVFDNARWLSVHTNIYDLSNWEVEDISFRNKGMIE